jgi:hypothetical protein
MDVFLLKGRSIDGTVWRAGDCWTTHAGWATAYRTHKGIDGALAEATWAFDHANLHDKVGGLEIKVYPLAEFEKLTGEAEAWAQRQEAAWAAEDAS